MRAGHWLIAVISGLLFVLAFRLNQVFDSYFVYSAGISLLFHPAGEAVAFVARSYAGIRWLIGVRHLFRLGHLARKNLVPHFFVCIH